MRFGFVVHPLTGFHRRLLGVRSADLRMATGHPTERPPARFIANLGLSDPTGRQVEGVLVGIPNTAEELLSDQESGVAAIIEAVRVCHEVAGANIVGLGAVAAVIGGQGKAVAREAPCAITTGNTFTAWAAVRTLDTFCGQGGRVLAPVGLLGAPGAVALGIMRLLVAEGRMVRVVAERLAPPLRRRIEELNLAGPGRVEFVSDALDVLRDRQVLVGASSTGGALRLSAVPRGSVIIDVALPRDVLDDVPRRDDVLIIDGEYVRLPSPLAGSSVWRRLYGLVTGQSRHIFACYAEPMLLSLAGIDRCFSLGRDIPWAV